MASNAESLPLRQATARKGAARMRARTWTAQEREQRRQQALARDQGRHLKTGYHGPWWTQEELALLAIMPDAEVARLTGRSVNAVRIRRMRQ